jgi:hypothetical protein
MLSTTNNERLLETGGHAVDVPTTGSSISVRIETRTLHNI